MLWGKKEAKAGLPDLPPMKGSVSMLRETLLELPDDDEDNERHALPSFPDSPTHNKFSQAVIKDAVNSDEELSELPERKVVEMREWTPEHLPPVIPEKSAADFSLPRTERSGSPDVFVKIDKFHSAKQTFFDVREKLEEIDDLIKKIRETKMREEQELAGWERDIAQAKARIHDVAENIFEKVE